MCWSLRRGLRAGARSALTARSLPDGLENHHRGAHRDVQRVDHLAIGRTARHRAGLGPRGDRFVGATAALSAPHELLAHRAAGTPILFWEGLECRRTGGAAPGVRADCARMHAMFELTPLATLTAPNRPFESDFFKDYLIHGETVTLAVYRVEGLRGAR